MPPQASQSSNIPPPPPGYTLDSQAGSIPPPPAGYTLDQAAPSTTQQQPPQQKPGFFTRLGQSVGIPTSREELAAFTVDSLNHPQDLIPITGPIEKMARGYENQVRTGFAKDKAEGDEATRDLQQGLITEDQAKGKILNAGVHSLINAVPFVGPAINTMGEDAQQGNWKGFAGGGTGVAGQILGPKLVQSATRGPAPTAPNVWEGEAPAEIPSGKGAVQGSDIGAKAKAVGKVAAQYGASKIPVAGALVRRPSFFDILDAMRAKGQPQGQVPAYGNVSNAEARGPYQPYQGDLRVNPSGDTDVAATQELPPAEAEVKPAQPNAPPVDQLYGKYSGRSNLAKNQKQMQRYKANVPEDQPETPFTPQPFFNPSVLERIFGMKVKTAKAGD